jgi:MoaA/NifB/PqqE/SkfB family radical SAM enzyme
MLPFTGIATREDGEIKICCKSWPIGEINNHTLEEVWNNDNMKRIRKQVLNNERPPECIGCFSYEDQDVESMRQRHITKDYPESRINMYPNILDSLNDDYTMPFVMPSIEIRLTNLCNLKCRMCSPMDSTSWNDWNEIVDFYVKEHSHIGKTIIELKLDEKPLLDSFENNERWWQSFEKLIPNINFLEFAGGEPLMDPSHYRILDMFGEHASNVDLKYATNLTTLGKGKRNVFDYWPRFKSVTVHASIDGVGDLFEYIRTNADWVEVSENIQKIKQIPTVKRILASVAVQATNIMSLDKTIEYFLDTMEVTFWNNFVKYPMILSAQVLPSDLKLLAIDRLITVRDKVPTFKMCIKDPYTITVAHNQIDNIIKFLQGEDYNHLWNDFVEFNHRLDKTRKQGPLEVIIPEFKDYV